MLKNAEKTEVKAVLMDLEFNGGAVAAPSGACFSAPPPQAKVFRRADRRPEPPDCADYPFPPC